MMPTDYVVVLPEMILAGYAMLALLVAVYGTKDAMAPMLT
jgi:NADH-quinone oxidoreductase subunit N